MNIYELSKLDLFVKNEIGTAILDGICVKYDPASSFEDNVDLMLDEFSVNHLTPTLVIVGSGFDKKIDRVYGIPVVIKRGKFVLGLSSLEEKLHRILLM